MTLRARRIGTCRRPSVRYPRRRGSPRSAHRGVHARRRREYSQPGLPRARRRRRPRGARMSSRACAYPESPGSGTQWKRSTAREKRCPVQRYFADSTRITRWPARWKDRASCKALVIFPPLIRIVLGESVRWAAGRVPLSAATPTAARSTGRVTVRPISAATVRIMCAGSVSHRRATESEPVPREGRSRHSR